MNHERLYPTAEELMHKARERAGLSNFGKPTFMLGFERLLVSLEEDANLTAEGRAAVIETIVRRLTRRLHVEEWYRTHPETAAVPILGPVSITGLPRTGTTALANMMSLDPQFRCLRMWEQLNPVPPPEPKTEAQDPRRLEFVRDLEGLLKAHPEQQVMHLYEVDATVEDTEILSMEFSHQNVTTPVFGYTSWWRQSDTRPTFAYQRRVVQLLGSRRPPNLWLFKAPHHKFHLEEFVSAYPNARFIFTHRDPAKSVPSYVSFVTSLYPPGTMARHDPHKIGRCLHEHLLDGMHRAVAARARLGDARFIDVYQREIDEYPLPMMRRIYDFLGYELTPQMLASLTRWNATNRVGAYGQHSYAPEQFGLSTDQIRSDYDFYIRKYDVPLAGGT